MVNVRSVALLASALSDQYGVNVTIGGREAYTTYEKGKKPVINIPAINSKDKKYQELLSGWIDHESSHVRFTDGLDTNTIVNKVGVVQKIANIFEDVFVERQMSQCFPGCKRNLRRMAELVFAAGEEGDGPDDPSKLMASLQDADVNIVDVLWTGVLNYILYRTRGQVIESIAAYIPKHRQPVDTIMPGLADAIDPILDRVPAEGVNTEANNALAVEVEKAIRDFMKQEQPPEQGQGGGQGQGKNKQDNQGGQDENAEADSGGQGTDQRGCADGNISDGDDKTSGGTDQADEGDEQQDGADSQSPGHAEQSDGGGSGSEPAESDALGSDEMRRNIADAFNEAGERMGEDDGPETDIGKKVAETIGEAIADDKESRNLRPCDMYGSEHGSSRWAASVKCLSDSEISDALKASVALDAQLQSLLQTYTLNRGGAGRVGKLDTHRLHKLAVGSDRIFNRRVEKQGIDTEVVLVVDMSGSMHESNKATLTSMSLYAVMKSLRKIQGCTSSVIGFSGSEVTEILRSGDKLTTRMQIQPGGGTHCGEALMQAMRRFSPRPDSRKIVIMMTDGDTANPAYFKHAIKSAKDSGIEVVGIGILDRSIGLYFNGNESCIIKSLGQMTPELFRILRTKLLRSAA